MSSGTVCGLIMIRATYTMRIVCACIDGYTWTPAASSLFDILLPCTISAGASGNRSAANIHCQRQGQLNEIASTNDLHRELVLVIVPKRTWCELFWNSSACV
jgi:hypothetical protein